MPPKPPKTSALEALGTVLDVPCSMVRDAFAAKNPFNQILTLSKPDNRTSGRDLLRQYKLADTAKNTWDNALAGFAAEVALDPTTYVGLGALTRVGNAASKAGLIIGSKPLAESISQTIRSIMESFDDVDAAHKAWKIAGGRRLRVAQVQC